MGSRQTEWWGRHSCLPRNGGPTGQTGMPAPPVMRSLPLLMLLLSCFLLPGCSDSRGAAATDVAGVTDQKEMVEGIFSNAIGLLNDLDEFDPNDVLPKIVGRLNQWVATNKPIGGWKVDPLVADLPEKLRQLLPMKTLGDARFNLEDGLQLQEAVWMRNTARAAVGRETDDLDRARRLFDWTIRNIELDADRTPSRRRKGGHGYSSTLADAAVRTRRGDRTSLGLHAARTSARARRGALNVPAAFNPDGSGEPSYQRQAGRCWRIVARGAAGQ